MLKLNVEDLSAGKLSVYESILELEPVKMNPNETSMEKEAFANKTVSSIDQPHLGVRFSVGLNPDAGLDFGHDKGSNKAEKEHVEASHKLWAPLPSKSFINESTVSQENLQINEDFLSSEPVLKYKFCIDLKKIFLHR